MVNLSQFNGLIYGEFEPIQWIILDYRLVMSSPVQNQ